MFDLYVRLPKPIERLVFDWVRLNFGSILFDEIRRDDYTAAAFTILECLCVTEEQTNAMCERYIE